MAPCVTLGVVLSTDSTHTQTYTQDLSGQKPRLTLCEVGGGREARRASSCGQEEQGVLVYFLEQWSFLCPSHCVVRPPLSSKSCLLGIRAGKMLQEVISSLPHFVSAMCREAADPGFKYCAVFFLCLGVGEATPLPTPEPSSLHPIIPPFL